MAYAPRGSQSRVVGQRALRYQYSPLQRSYQLVLSQSCVVRRRFRSARREVNRVLLTDPFREIDRWTEQLLGTAARPALMAMDAWREGTQIVVEFDLPGVRLESLDVDVERNMLTVRGERPAPGADHEMVSAERRMASSVGRYCSVRTSTPTR